MSKTRHRLLAIMALLLAMLTVMPSAMADMRGINVSGRAVSERHVHRRLRLRRRQGHAGHRLHQRVHDQPGQLRAAAGQEPRLLPLPGGGNATAEADYFVNTVRPYLGRAVLVLDWESYQNSAWGNSGWIRVFVNRVHARTGVWPLVYTSAAYLHQIPADVRSHCGLWVAQYANNNATGYQTRPWNYGRYGEAMRQYTSNGRIAGYAGPLGLNYFAAPPRSGTNTPAPATPPSRRHRLRSPSPHRSRLGRTSAAGTAWWCVPATPSAASPHAPDYGL